MKKTLEFKLLVTIENDTLSVEVTNVDDDLPVMPDYKGSLNVSVNVDNENTYNTSSTWHGSEEMWYTTYKE
jgi:hypothetical protein